MTPRDTKRINQYYTSALDEFGPADARSVHWIDATGQYARFRVLAAIIENSIENEEDSDPATNHVPTILDVGCGTGELYNFLLTESLRTRKPPVKYFGIDIVPELVAAAKQRFPDTHFEVCDVFDLGKEKDDAGKPIVPAQFDYVLASGALTFKVADNLNYYQAMIRKMYSLASKGLGFNMLTDKVHIDDETYAAYDPKEIAEFCHTLTQSEPNGHVEIVLDYLPQDFTVYMRK